MIARFAACVVLFASSTIAQNLWLPRVFGDHMVLQRNESVAVWGRGISGDAVEVAGSWGGEAATGTVAVDGTFRVALRTPGASGPHQLRVKVGNDTRTFEDVLVGEVWVCSGQSNMEWSVRRSADPEKTAQGATESRLRFCVVPNVTAVAPQEDCEAEWVVSTPETTSGLSAVGYHFARKLIAQYDVPVGMIQSDWGGTPAESWTSDAGLRPLGDFDERLDKLAELAANPDAAEAAFQSRLDSWREAFAKAEPGSKAAWHKADFDDAGWKTATLPGNWEDTELGRIDGTVWYRRTVSIPPEWKGRSLTIELGPVDDNDVTWLNGVEIGATNAWNKPRRYFVRGSSAPTGEVSLAVRVHDTGGGGGFHGQSEQMVVRRIDNGATISLAGEWRVHVGADNKELPAPPRKPGTTAHAPTSLFNGMIAPIVPFTMRGVIWYQGESNRTRAAQYRDLFPAMIRDWRAKWGRGDFPFYFVQIAPYGYSNDTGQAAELKEAQLRTMRDVRNTGMVVTTDVGNPRDIHPKDKKTVGERLAAWAIAETYRDAGVACRGPSLHKMTVDGAAVSLHFRDADGLHAGPDGPTCFTVAGSDRAFHPATAKIEGTCVVVSCDAVAAPVAVRFGWGATDEPALKNAAGLPASPFRTDDWPMVTAK